MRGVHSLSTSGPWWGARWMVTAATFGLWGDMGSVSVNVHLCVSVCQHPTMCQHPPLGQHPPQQFCPLSRTVMLIYHRTNSPKSWTKNNKKVETNSVSLVISGTFCPTTCCCRWRRYSPGSARECWPAATPSLLWCGSVRMRSTTSSWRPGNPPWCRWHIAHSLFSPLPLCFLFAPLPLCFLFAPLPLFFLFSPLPLFSSSSFLFSLSFFFFLLLSLPFFSSFSFYLFLFSPALFSASSFFVFLFSLLFLFFSLLLFFLFTPLLFFSPSFLFFRVWCVECCCVCHQGQICRKADTCLNLYPSVIKYYFIFLLSLLCEWPLCAFQYNMPYSSQLCSPSYKGLYNRTPYSSQLCSPSYKGLYNSTAYSSQLRSPSNEGLYNNTPYLSQLCSPSYKGLYNNTPYSS